MNGGEPPPSLPLEQPPAKNLLKGGRPPPRLAPEPRPLILSKLAEGGSAASDIVTCKGKKPAFSGEGATIAVGSAAPIRLLILMGKGLQFFWYKRWQNWIVF